MYDDKYQNVLSKITVKCRPTLSHVFEKKVRHLVDETQCFRTGTQHDGKYDAV